MNARSLARRLAQRIFDNVLAPEVAAECTQFIFHNVLRKQAKEKKWTVRLEGGTGDDADAVARMVAANAVHNVLRKHKAVWKESRSYQQYVRMKEHRNNGQGKLSYQFRDTYVTCNSDGAPTPFMTKHPWLKDTPKVVRQQAAFQAAAAFKSAFANLRNNNISRFHVRFRSKKYEQQHGYTLGIEKFATLKGADGKWSLTLLARSGIGKVRCFEKPPMSNKPAGDCHIHKDNCGDYWLLVPFYKHKKDPTCRPALAIDPGGVVPFACYSPAGHAFFDGEDLKARLKVVEDRVAVVDKRIAKGSGPLLDHLRLKRRKLFRTVKNVRAECHYQTLNRWTKVYGAILLPRLQTRRLSGGLRTKANREMFGISHWTFLQRARAKCEEASCLFAIPNESCTTKTCGRCGTYKQGITLTDRMFHCRRCGLRMNRDLAAARNIYVRWLAETSGAASAE